MNVLVVDVGGTSVKLLATGQETPRAFPSGRTLTPEEMVLKVGQTIGEWKYDVVSLGYPGPVVNGRPVEEPCNLAPGWVRFDYEQAFDCPVKLTNGLMRQIAPCVKTECSEAESALQHDSSTNVLIRHYRTRRSRT